MRGGRTFLARSCALGFLTILLSVGSNNAAAALLSGIGGAPSDPVFIGPVTIDFESTTSGAYNATTIGNTTFTGLDGAYTIDTQYNGSYNINGLKSLHSIPGPPPNFTILPSKIEMFFTLPVSAVAFNWGAADNVWQMSAYDSANALIETNLIALSPNSSVNNGEYFGVVSPDIKRIVLIDQKDAYLNGDEVFIDDVTTSFEALPEPSSAAVMVFGLAAYLMRRRRL
ncbi:MAG: PEP-CTERM sorting domain-containing protein [Burkholderiales bacterium]|nr:PEP-CTERM sorting domain-containing protein [Phycisphaerae bacterium]